MHTQARSFEFLYRHVALEERQPWDCVLFESRSFVAIPTIGALLEGWLLIVPKQHHLCFGAMETEALDEFAEFKMAVVDAVEQAYGSVAAFEHGPAARAQSPGCGVDHAHMHILPAPCDLAEAASEVFDGQLTWHEGVSLRDAGRLFRERRSYLYVEQPIGAACITSHPGFPSQLMRKAIASHLGIRDRFDWREYPMLDHVVRTAKRLQSVSQHSASMIRATA